MKRATIADVAALAGVSKSTVSHALSGKRPISAETRHRIQQAIAELGYQPNPVAQRLAGGRSRTIGFVFPLYAPTIAGLEIKFITGAANVINQADYAFLLLTHPQQNSDHLQRFVQSGLVDGFILMQVQLKDPRVELLRRAGLPFVLIGRCADNHGLAYVDVDANQAIIECIEHLAGLGHRTIAYLHQDEPTFGFTVRAQQQFKESCQAHDLSPILQPCALSSESGRVAMEILLDHHPRPTAVIVWNDLAAWGGLQAARARNIQVPADLSLITFGSSTISELAAFKPTAVDIRPAESAAQAAEILVELLEGESMAQTQILLSPRFLIGDSTAPA